MHPVLRWGAVTLAGGLLAGLLAIGRGLAWAPPVSLSDLAYDAASESQKLDLYLPAGEGPFPVVVYIHGGAFRFGDKREPFAGFRADVDLLRGMGIALASINYRMSGEARFPAAVRDAQAAVRWLRTHSAQLHLRPDAIAVWGKSAGANLALELALGAAAPLPASAPADPPEASSAVQAVIAMYGPTDFLSMDRQAAAAGCGSASTTHDQADSPESRYLGAPVQSVPDLARQASPVFQVSNTVPPALIEAGTADCTVPWQQSQELFDALQPRVGPAQVRLRLLPGAGHGDSAFDAPDNLAVVADFLRPLLLAAPGSRAAISLARTESRP